MSYSTASATATTSVAATSASTTSKTTSKSSLPGTTVTVTSTPTLFLPITTAWPQKSDCVSRFFQYASNTFIDWKLTGEDTCLPPQVQEWRSRTLALHVALGPTFVCPDFYTAVHTAVQGPLQQTYCCPTEYDLQVPGGAGDMVPSQCRSVFAGGNVATYQSIGQISTKAEITTTFNSLGATVWAYPVNGFNFAVDNGTIAASTTADRSTTDPPARATTEITPTTTATEAASDTSNRTSTGVYVGASVGSVLGFLLLAFVAFFFWRRDRRRKQLLQDDKEGRIDEKKADQPNELSDKTSHAELPSGVMRTELPVEEVPAELVVDMEPVELPSDNYHYPQTGQDRRNPTAP